MDTAHDIAAVAALDEPARRCLYDYVCSRPDPVGRDEASEALCIPRKTAAFHLDKLTVAGLLTVEFARLTGRTGPGGGTSVEAVSAKRPCRRGAVARTLL